MGTRLGVRVRPLDLNKPLIIVRTVDELDNSEQLFKDPAPGDKNGQVAKKGAKEIPVPDVRHVPTHYRDYLPAHVLPPTYIRGKAQPVGGVRPDHRYVEYDLDAEDEDWVDNFGLGGSKLSDQKFERMLWVLELACAEAQELLWNAAGASYAERTSAVAVANTDALGRMEATSILQTRVGCRDNIAREVVNYWLGKRKRWGKPLLRRLQAPTPANDSNPHRVFRPRDKVNRPQTRRRRENTEDCYDKLKQMKENLTAVRGIVDEIVRRERRKRDLMCTELEFLNIELQKRLQQNKAPDEFFNAALNTLKERMKFNQDNDKRRTALMVLPNGNIVENTDANAALRPSRRLRTPHMLSVLRPHLARCSAPPRPLEEDLAFTHTVQLNKLVVQVKGPNGAMVNTTQVAQPTGEGGLVHPLWRLPDGFPWELSDPNADFQVVRMGRNGRARIDRCDPLSGDTLQEYNQEITAARQDAWPALPKGPHLTALIAEMQPGSPVFAAAQHQARAASRQSSHGVTAQGSMPLASMASAQAAQLRQAAVQQQLQQQQAAAAAAAAQQAAAAAAVPVQAANAAQPVAMGRGSSGGAPVAAAAGGEGAAAGAAAAGGVAAGGVPAAATPAPAAVPPVAVAAPDSAAAAGSSGQGAAGWYGAAASAAMASVGGNPAATVVAPTAPPNIAGAVQTPVSASTVAAKRTPAVKTESKLPGTSSGQLPPSGPRSDRRGPGRPPKRQDE